MGNLCDCSAATEKTGEVVILFPEEGKEVFQRANSDDLASKSTAESSDQKHSSVKGKSRVTEKLGDERTEKVWVVGQSSCWCGANGAATNDQLEVGCLSDKPSFYFEGAVSSHMEAYNALELEPLTREETIVLTTIASHPIAEIEAYQVTLLEKLFNCFCLGRNALGLDDIAVIADFCLRATALSNHPDGLTEVLLHYYKSPSQPLWYMEEITNPPNDLQLTKNDFVQMVQENNVDKEIMLFLGETALSVDNPTPISEAVKDAFESLYVTLNSRLSVNLLHPADQVQMRKIVSESARQGPSKEEFEGVAIKLMTLLRVAIVQAWISTHQKNIRHPLLVSKASF